MKKELYYTYLLFIFFTVSCSQCKDDVDCEEEIDVINLVDEPKVIWFSLLFPDSTYHCSYVKNSLSGGARITIPFARGGCWNEVLSSKPLQVFVLDSIVSADSTCEAIRANPQLYQRMEFTLDELKGQNYVVSVE